MGDEEGRTFADVWETYCPCRWMKKNIVLMCLTFCCFALVTWTVVATIKPPKLGPSNNVTYVMIDDSKDLELLNFTLSSAVQKAAAAKKIKTTPAPKASATFYRKIEDPMNNETICKCMCQATSEGFGGSWRKELITYLEINEEDELAMNNGNATKAEN